MRPISASFASRKFDSPFSGGTQRSSLNQTVEPLQLAPAREAISYASFGVEPPVSTSCEPRSPASASISATTAAGFSSTRMSIP